MPSPAATTVLSKQPNAREPNCGIAAAAAPGCEVKFYIRPHSRPTDRVRDLAAREKKLMTQIPEAQIVLKICPTSNLPTKALATRTRCARPFGPSRSTTSSSLSPPTARR